VPPALPPATGNMKPSRRICIVMEPNEKRKYLAAALREPEIRRACHLVERIITAGDILDHMSPTTLEVVRDYCAERTTGTTGASNEFRRAWIKLVVDHLNDARMLERRLCCGITGSDREPA
jgi:hypothetical protein